MKKNKKSVVQITEGNPNETTDVLQDNARGRAEKLKKPLIFILMGIVFLGCMYLIFDLSEKQQEEIDVGLNDAVPQATNERLPEDKEEAYEQEMLKKRQQEKRDAMMSLSDYWNSELQRETPDVHQEESKTVRYAIPPPKKQDPGLNSYRYAQSTLNSFYKDDNHENRELQKKVEELKVKLKEKEEPRPNTMEDQLTLMEESYKMAAKYLPGTNTRTQKESNPIPGSKEKPTNFHQNIQAVYRPQKTTVSTLYKEKKDSIKGKKNSNGFHTMGTGSNTSNPKNSIRACIHETKAIGKEGYVRLRLLEPIHLGNDIISKGTTLMASAKLNQGRLYLHISSLEWKGNIVPVDIVVYDLDGQKGLFLPNSPELDALAETVSGMGNSTGTNITMNSSTGQQLTGELTKGFIEGVSGYFSKKMDTPKITLKAGYRIYLLPQNQ